jgi:hypothetical protein|tara:strand:+ start:1705 stop:2124 length:420 start_codon:yes stop_codon:yes gene_type:complete
MTAKGQARGPNHYIDPPGGTHRKEPTGVQVKRKRKAGQSRERFVHTAKEIGDNIGEWCHMTTYPFVQGIDMLKSADSLVTRLNLTGRKNGMTLIARELRKNFGPSCFDVCRVEATTWQQPDGSIEVMVRWMPIDAVDAA